MIVIRSRSIAVTAFLISLVYLITTNDSLLVRVVLLIAAMS